MDKQDKQIRRVYIDQGHGGLDPGKLANGLVEADLNLLTAKHTADRLHSRGMEVLLARRPGVQLHKTPNGERVRRILEANTWKADAYVSIHYNGSGGRGTETFAQLYDEASHALALAVQSAVVGALGTVNRGVRFREWADRVIVHPATFPPGGRDYYQVLRDTDMPAVIVEVCFLDNAADAAIA
ncbi:MAG: N-acetylmuramoyl-L-alanine amidase, partial [Dehalococcoidia bacterium]|nr:N-acetylmuramoyl-L-alanine amidase [Dehalococcoidia bacterium]